MCPHGLFTQSWLIEFDQITNTKWRRRRRENTTHKYTVITQLLLFHSVLIYDHKTQTWISSCSYSPSKPRSPGKKFKPLGLRERPRRAKVVRVTKLGEKLVSLTFGERPRRAKVVWVTKLGEKFVSLRFRERPKRAKVVWVTKLGKKFWVF